MFTVVDVCVYYCLYILSNCLTWLGANQGIHDSKCSWGLYGQTISFGTEDRNLVLALRISCSFLQLNV